MVKAIISEHVSEPVLGYDWMTDVGALFDCGREKLILNHREYKLQPQPANGWVRNVVSESQHDKLVACSDEPPPCG